MDEDIPTFDADTTVRDISDELVDHVCFAKCDHKNVQVLVTTQRQTETRRRTRTRTRGEPKGNDEAPTLEESQTFWEETEEFDATDIERVEDTEAHASEAQVAPPQDDLPAPPTMEEIAEGQRVDDFCQTVLERQSGSEDSALFEDPKGC